MSVDLEPALTEDSRDLYCPSPVLRAQEAMWRLRPGQILRILATDPAAEADIKSWAKRVGHAILDFTNDGQELTFLVRKG